MRLFLSSKIRCPGQQLLNTTLSQMCESAGHVVYKPQDAVPIDSTPSSRLILEANEQAVDRCDVALVVFDNAGVGVAMEYARSVARGKRIIGYRTVNSINNERLGAMMEGAWDRLADTSRASTLDHFRTVVAALSNGATLEVDVRTFYNLVADEYSDSDLHRQTAQSRAIATARTMEVLGTERFASAVDLGCGDSPILSILPATRVAGVDSSIEMLRLQHRRCPQAMLVLAECHDTGLRDAYVDLLHCSFVLDHVDNVDALLDESRRLLVRGGLAIVNVHAPDALEGVRDDACRMQYHSRDGTVYIVRSNPEPLRNLRGALERRFRVVDLRRLEPAEGGLAVDHYVARAE